MTTKIVHPHITSDPDIGSGKPIISGTRTRVSTIVSYYKLGNSAEELAREFPHLSLSQIHDALSFYHDHSSQIDEDIEQDKEAYLRPNQP